LCWDWHLPLLLPVANIIVRSYHNISYQSVAISPKRYVVSVTFITVNYDVTFTRIS
jgi:hypothetical protein